MRQPKCYYFWDWTYGHCPGPRAAAVFFKTRDDQYNMYVEALKAKQENFNSHVWYGRLGDYSKEI